MYYDIATHLTGIKNLMIFMSHETAPNHVKSRVRHMSEALTNQYQPRLRDMANQVSTLIYHVYPVDQQDQ